MRFRKGARLDPSQVEDYRGAGGGRRTGAPMALGGGGIVTIVIVLAIILLGGNPLGGGTSGGLGDLVGQTVGPGTASTELQQECRTGEDANEREDCAVVAIVNSVQAYWSKALRGYEPARTRFFEGGIQTGCGAASSAVGAVLLSARPVRLHRPRLLRPAPVAARSARWATRGGVRARARVRPPRPEPDRRARVGRP